MISSDKFAVIIRWQKFLGPVMYSNLTLPPNRYWFFFFCGWSSLLCMNQTDNILSHSPRAITLIVRILVNVPVFYISVVLVSSQAVFNDKRCFLPADSCSVSEYAQARRDHFFFLSERKKGSFFFIGKKEGIIEGEEAAHWLPNLFISRAPPPPPPTTIPRLPQSQPCK